MRLPRAHLGGPPRTEPHAARTARGALLGLALRAATLPGCDHARGPVPLQQRCACDYMTDLDAPGVLEVEVCASVNEVEAVAHSCAVSGGVGAVTGCRCQRTAHGCAGEPACRLARDAPAAPSAEGARSAPDAVLDRPAQPR